MSILRDSLAVGGVVLEGVEQPLQASLVIVVFLAFYDNLLSAVDELVTALGGEVFVRQEGLGTIKFIANAIFMLLRDPARNAVLQHTTGESQFGDGKCRNYPHSTESLKHALALGLGAGGLVADLFGNLLIGRLFNHFLRAGSLSEYAPLLLFGASGRIRGDAVPVKYKTREGAFRALTPLRQRHGDPQRF